MISIEMNQNFNTIRNKIIKAFKFSKVKLLRTLFEIEFIQQKD